MEGKDKVIKMELDSYMTLDQLNTLAIEYATTVDSLVNIAIQRLFDDLEFARALRRGSITPVRHPNERT